MKKSVNVVLNVEEKTFTSDKGEVIKYLDSAIVLDGEVIKIKVANDSKSLYKYLISKVK